MTDAARLDSTLRQYEAALTQLEAAPSPPTEAVILDVLIGRWWKFPQPLDPRDRLDWLWSGLTLACLTASLSLLMDISSKFFESGPDLFGSFTVVSQSVLTLLAGGSALTQTGREATETLLQRVGFSKYRWNEAKFGIAAGLLLLLIGIHPNLPQIASLSSQWGRNNVQAGELSSAQNNYQRSLQLNPNNAKTHYSLGKVYDDLQKNEQAEAQYQLAVKGGVPQAYIRLSRLYILNRKHGPLRTNQPHQNGKRAAPLPIAPYLKRIAGITSLNRVCKV